MRHDGQPPPDPETHRVVTTPARSAINPPPDRRLVETRDDSSVNEFECPPELAGILSTDHYRRDIRSSGLSVATALTARLRTIPAAESAEVAQSLNWKHSPGPKFGDWLAIPYFGIDGQPTNYVRFKPDRPRQGKNDRPVKYEAPVGLSPRLYFPPNQSQGIYVDDARPLIIVEGEKKALALVQHGFAAIGIAGVWSWTKKRTDDSKPRELIDDFRHFMLTGRSIIILFDSDLASNDKVAWAAFHFSETLKAAGAVVRIAHLAPGMNGEKVGADDVLVKDGPDVIQAALDTAQPPERPRTTESSFEWTDVGNARRFATFAQGRIRYVDDRGVWFVFDGRRWAEDSDGVRVEAVAKEMLRSWAFRLADQIATITKMIAEVTVKADVETLQSRKERWEEEFKFAKKCQDLRRVRAMMALARSEAPFLVSNFSDTFDINIWLVNCANGTFDVRTGEFRDHDPEDYLTKLTPVRYNPTAVAPCYHTFLKQIFRNDHELIAFIRRLSGVAATGDASDQALNICWGEGANGKTTLIELWIHVLGEYAGKVPEELLIADKSNSRHPCEKVLLYGLRLAVASETGQGGRLDEARVKALTGGDTISARGMHENFWNFKPHYTLFLLTNHPPHVRGTDHGIWRRIRLIPFETKYWTDADRTANPESTYEPDRKADPTMPEQLKAEAEGILRDMLDQAAAHYAADRTINVPACVSAKTKMYRESEDVLGEFFAARVRPDRNTLAKPSDRRRIKATVLYQAYKTWADEAGDSTHGRGGVVGRKTFLNDMKKRLDSQMSNGLVFFADLRDESSSVDLSEDQPTTLDDWKNDGQNPGDPEKQNSTPYGEKPEITFQSSNLPNQDVIVLTNTDEGGVW